MYLSRFPAQTPVRGRGGVRFALWLAYALASLGPACGADAPTETGNPSALDRALVRIMVVGGNVLQVDGAAGAAPAGALVRVENLSSGISNESQADETGAFSVTIAGAPEDELEVSVKGERTVLSAETGEAGAGPDEGADGALSCDDVGASGREALNSLVEGIASGCRTASECLYFTRPPECSAFVCGFPLQPVAESNAAEFRAALIAAEGATCSAAAELGCLFGQGANCVDVQSFPTYELSCVEGECLAVDGAATCSLDGLLQTQGDEFIACGAVRVGGAAEADAEEVAEQRGAYACFRDAFADCTPAVLRMDITGTDSRWKENLAVIEQDGTCLIESFRDDRDGFFEADPGEHRSQCATLPAGAADERPVPEDCTPVANCSFIQPIPSDR